MEFRWLALVALWTVLSGPIFGTATGPASGARKPDPTHVAKAPIAKARLAATSTRR
jgi:hypothetical protein